MGNDGREKTLKIVAMDDIWQHTILPGGPVLPGTPSVPLIPRSPFGPRSPWEGGREGGREGERERGREEGRERGREAGEKWRECVIERRAEIYLHKSA